MFIDTIIENKPLVRVNFESPVKDLIYTSGFCVGGWMEADDSSMPRVIEVYGIDETPALMSFSQLIHWFTCKWLLKGYWLWLPSACTYYGNIMLSDTSTLNTDI